MTWKAMQPCCVAAEVQGLQEILFSYYPAGARVVVIPIPRRGGGGGGGEWESGVILRG